MINGNRVRQVREIKGLTQIQFAEMIGINQSAVAQIESGRISPQEATIERMVLKTGFPVSFFKQPTSVEFPSGSLLFRARASMTLRERSTALQCARLIFEMMEKTRESAKVSPINSPKTEGAPTNAVSAAMQTRNLLGLSQDLPVGKLINLLERNGVIVLSLPTEIERQDAFSAWVGSETRRPVIAICNRKAPGDRLRFSVAHELGHLIMHRAIVGNEKRLETEANAFASEFLMPAEAASKEIVSPLTLPKLVPLKERWKVSIQFLIKRAYDLKLISQRQYKYLMYQVVIRGWRKEEPIDIPIEKPRLLGQLTELVYGGQINHKKIASDMMMPHNLVKEILEGCSLKVSRDTSATPNDLAKKINKVVQLTKLPH